MPYIQGSLSPYWGKEHPPTTIIIRLIIPVALACAYFFLTFLVLPFQESLILGGLMLIYYVPPAGKESIIPIGIGLGIPWWIMAVSLALLDVLTSLFMILNFNIALRIPVLGPWISHFLASGEEFMETHSWISKWSVLGVALFVLLPLQGTGGVGATLVGIITGLSPPKILLAIGCGAMAECLVFALGSHIIWQLIMDNLFLGLGAAALAISGLILIYILFRRWRPGIRK